MFKTYLLIFLLGHILGDFYVQTRKMSEKKEKEQKWVFIHGASYYLTICFTVLPFQSSRILILVTAAALLHLIIDFGKHHYCARLKKNETYTPIKERNIFFIDQFLHLICIIAIAYSFAIKIPILETWPGIDLFFATIDISKMTVLSWALAMLTLHKPANIMIQKLLTIYKPKKHKTGKKDNSAGRFIGTIERMIMLIFLAFGQYSAIGLVLSAKSIARYDRISKDQDFAEYYLLGTLISTLIVISISVVL